MANNFADENAFSDDGLKEDRKKQFVNNKTKHFTHKTPNHTTIKRDSPHSQFHLKKHVQRVRAYHKSYAAHINKKMQSAAAAVANDSTKAQEAEGHNKTMMSEQGNDTHEECVLYQLSVTRGEPGYVRANVDVVSVTVGGDKKGFVCIKCHAPVFPVFNSVAGAKDKKSKSKFWHQPQACKFEYEPLACPKRPRESVVNLQRHEIVVDSGHEKCKHCGELVQFTIENKVKMWKHPLCLSPAEASHFNRTKRTVMPSDNASIKQEPRSDPYAPVPNSSRSSSIVVVTDQHASHAPGKCSQVVESVPTGITVTAPLQVIPLADGVHVTVEPEGENHISVPTSSRTEAVETPPTAPVEEVVSGKGKEREEEPVESEHHEPTAPVASDVPAEPTAPPTEPKPVLKSSSSVSLPTSTSAFDVGRGSSCPLLPSAPLQFPDVPRPQPTQVASSPTLPTTLRMETGPRAVSAPIDALMESQEFVDHCHDLECCTSLIPWISSCASSVYNSFVGTPGGGKPPHHIPPEYQELNNCRPLKGIKLTRDELEDCLDNVEPGAIAGRIWDATEPYLGDRRLAHLRTVAEVKSPMRIYLLTYRATPLYTLLAVLSLLMCSWILAVVAIKLPSQHVRYLFSLVTLALTYLTGRVTPQPAFLSMVKFIGAIFLLSFQYLLPDYDTVISSWSQGLLAL
jgi:hypothetical protein